MRETLEITKIQVPGELPNGVTNNREIPKVWPQILAIFSGSLAAMTCGMHFGWSSPTIPRIVSDHENYHISLEQASYFTVIPPVVSALSGFMYFKIIDLIGRKWTMLSIAVPHSMAWILVGSTNSIWTLYLSRVFVGIADACLFTTLPTYISEVATPHIRGSWGNLMSFFIFFGQFAINVVGSYLSIQHTAYLCLMVPIAFAITFVFMPESPYYLIMEKRHDDAKLSLQTLRRLNDVDYELAKLEKDVDRQLSESGTWKDLFTIVSNRKALYAGVFLRIGQQLAGAAVFAVYCQYIFRKAGQNISADASSMIFTGFCTVLNMIAIFTVDRFGRIKSYSYSAFFCGFVLLVEAVYFYLDQHQTDVNLENYRWVPLGGLLLFASGFCFGLSIIPTLMLGELFSQNIKGKGLCILNLAFSILVSLVTKLFQVLDTNVGLYCPFLVFAISCFFTAGVTHLFVPETKGRTLEEIQQVLKGNDPKKRKLRINTKIAQSRF